MEHPYTEDNITLEMLEKLKRKAMLLEDELAIEGGRQFEKTGKLNDPGLCEKSLEYENLSMDIRILEERLAAAAARESNGQPSAAGNVKKTD